MVTFMPDEGVHVPEEEGHTFDVDQQLLGRVSELEGQLQNTRESLQASIEQQETSNEELQAANEELLAGNEELQSTNEELESVNEELYTVNAEYQGKIQELLELNDDMENFTRSTDIGTIFFDRKMRIRRFTPVFGRVTGLEETDVGRNLSTFAHPVLLAVLAATPHVLDEPGMRHEEILELDQKGTFLLRVMPYRVDGETVEGVVATLVDVGRVFDAEAELKMVLQTMDLGVCVTDEKGCFVQVNEAYCRIYGYKEKELVGRHFSMVVPGDFQDAARKMHDEFIQTGQEIPAIWDVVDKTGASHRVAVRARLLELTNGRRRKITIVTDMEDLAKLYGDFNKLDPTI
jgi:two-component system CheB/CheR fusion protein